MSSKIDDFFKNLYRPLNKFVPSYELWLASLKTSHPLYDLLMAAGSKIPTVCIFKKKFKLNFTPCKMNPLYEYLMALKLWTNYVRDKEYIANIINDPNFK